MDEQEEIKEQAIAPQKPQKNKALKIVKVVVSSILVLMAITIFAFSVQFKVRYTGMLVDGESMMPTLNTTVGQHDSVYIKKNSTVKNGELVVLYTTINGKKENIIKRCIAVGGQSVNIVGENKIGEERIGNDTDEITINLYESYFVKVDGKRIDEPYIIDATNKEVMQKEFRYFTFWKHQQGVADENLEKPITLKDDEIFVLGDNRLNSTDSSSLGPLKTSDIVGRVDFIVKDGQTLIKEWLQKFKIMFIIKK